MNSLIYIVHKSIKNSLLELKKTPAKLVMYLFVVAMLVFVIIISAFTKRSVDELVPLFWLKGIFFAYVTMIFVVAVAKGFSSGDNIFEMSDVNLLFVAPISPRKILFYGILRLAKAAFLAGFFILFQSTSVGSNFGVSFAGILLILLVFMASVILSSILSLLIYSVSNGNPKRKYMIKVIACLLYTPLILYMLVQYLQTQDLMITLEKAIHSPLLTWIPVTGWSAQSITALLSGDLLYGLLFLGIVILASVLCVFYIIASRADYYEDVLVATETAFEKKRALAEGNVNTMGVSHRKIQVTQTGIRWHGAKTLFSKHLRETFRQNRLGFFNVLSFFIILGAAAMAYLIPDSDCLTILPTLMGMQIFLIGIGRGLKELYSHYIYLIPASSFSKIVWSNMETVLKTLIESILIFSAVGIITQSNIGVILSAIIVYALFSMLLLGVNYLSMRWTNADLSAAFLIFFYFLAVLLIMAPGLVASIIVGTLLGGNLGMAVGLLMLAAWELIAALICFALSQGFLHSCDIQVMKTAK